MDREFEAIIAADSENALEALSDFVNKATDVFSFPELQQGERRKNLWKSLYRIGNETSDPQCLVQCFSTIRILSREKTCLNQLVSEDWLDFMKKQSGLDDEHFTITDDNKAVVLEVLKCMSNIIFNSAVAAGISGKNGTLEAIIKRTRQYKDPNFPDDIKILEMKLLFLITALCPDVRNRLKKEHPYFRYLTENLEFLLVQAAQNVPHNADTPIISLSDKQADLAIEIFKALFNLTLQCISDSKDEEELAFCMELVQILRSYLLIPTPSKEKTRMLQNNAINLLTNMPNESYQCLITKADSKTAKKLQYDGHNMTTIYEMLIILKEKFVEETSVSDQHGLLSPILTVLLKCAQSGRFMRKYLKLKILPPLKDVHNLPEEGGSLRGCLCRLLTSPIVQLKNIAAELLFVLCKMSVQRMIKYTGYGNAAGLFAKRGLLGGREDEGKADFSSDSEDSETEEYAELKHGINPITGRFELPHPDPMENMSEEQKEYEAMKLVELIDNLTRCGAIKPCRVGEDGKPEPIEHVLQLREGLRSQRVNRNSDDSD